MGVDYTSISLFYYFIKNFKYFWIQAFSHQKLQDFQELATASQAQNPKSKGRKTISNFSDSFVTHSL
jgi:hypothetical protein